jgi:putative DNA primase/helicase
MISDGEISIRPLGRSEQIRVDCRAMTIFANGNNITCKGDLVRRTLTARLDAKSERPETRTFTFDPIDWVRAERGKFIAAAFTIARAYLLAAPGFHVIPFAGFEGWSRFVRESLIWLDELDPASVVEGLRAMDPDRQNLRTLLKHLRQHFEIGAPFTAAQVAARADEATMLDRKPKHPEFRDLLLVKGKLSVKSIGRLLTRQTNRHVDGYWLELAWTDDKTANAYWLRSRGDGLARARV